MRSPQVTIAERYELREVVGRGGMGEVWAARDTRLHRDVAVKLLSAQMASEPAVRARFETEARSAACLNHPNVVSVFDTGEHDGVPFLVMELLPGRTLADEMRDGPLDAARACDVGAQVLAAVGASHAAGILHRDIKPGNVLLTAEGTAKVSDFGIAKSTEGLNVTSVGMVVGTASYLAPERVAGEPATPQSDLYAVGVVLYEALTGRRPFDADTPIGMMRAIESGTPSPLSELCPGLDPGLAATVERAMDRDPARRFGTASEMAESLKDRAPTAPDAVSATIATAAFPTTEATPSSATAETLAVPVVGADTMVTEHLHPSAPVTVHRARWLRDRAVMVGLVVAILLVAAVLLLAGGNDPQPSSSTSSVPAAGVPAPEGTLAPDLDRAIERLEDAVRP